MKPICLPPRYFVLMFAAMFLGTPGLAAVAQDGPAKPTANDELFLEKALRWVRSEASLTVDEYQLFRTGVMKLNERVSHASSWNLSTEEQVANRYFDFMRQTAIQPYQGQGERLQSQFPPARPFPQVR